MNDIDLPVFSFPGKFLFAATLFCLLGSSSVFQILELVILMGPEALYNSIERLQSNETILVMFKLSF